MIKRFLTEEKWSTIAYILNIVGLVMIFTRKSWDTYNPWYGLIGGLLIVLGFSINTYIDFHHPFRQAETSKKFGNYISNLRNNSTHHLAYLYNI